MYFIWQIFNERLHAPHAEKDAANRTGNKMYCLCSWSGLVHRHVERTMENQKHKFYLWEKYRGIRKHRGKFPNIAEGEDLCFEEFMVDAKYLLSAGHCSRCWREKDELKTASVLGACPPRRAG